MLEVEAKFRLNDIEALRHRLQALGATLTGSQQERDIYLSAPDRDFARTDEAFRLRVTGEENCLTYKGPRRISDAKTRVEIEAPLIQGGQAANQMLNLLAHLGYRKVAEVVKLRQTHEIKLAEFDVLICEDHVEKVGKFVEIEIILENESKHEEARKVLSDIANRLELRESETRSYLEQLLGRATIPGGEKPC